MVNDDHKFTGKYDEFNYPKNFLKYDNVDEKQNIFLVNTYLLTVIKVL